MEKESLPSIPCPPEFPPQSPQHTAHLVPSHSGVHSTTTRGSDLLMRHFDSDSDNTVLQYTGASGTEDEYVHFLLLPSKTAPKDSEEIFKIN